VQTAKEMRIERQTAQGRTWEEREHKRYVHGEAEEMWAESRERGQGREDRRIGEKSDRRRENSDAERERREWELRGKTRERREREREIEEKRRKRNREREKEIGWIDRPTGAQKDRQMERWRNIGREREREHQKQRKRREKIGE